MARVRRWNTTAVLTAAATTLPFWVELVPPADAVPGTTVLRLFGSVQVMADVEPTVSRPPLLRAGVIVGAEPVGGELFTSPPNDFDWLWFGGEIMTPRVLNDISMLLTDPSAPLGRISSGGHRRLEAGQNAWLLVELGFPFGIDLNLLQILVRTLYLLPE